MYGNLGPKILIRTAEWLENGTQSHANPVVASFRGNGKVWRGRRGGGGEGKEGGERKEGGG